MDLPIKIPNSGHLQTYKLKTKHVSYKLPPTYTSLNCLTCHNNNNSKYLLNNVNCEAKPGELTALAGPSGAGKTTLLEILAGVNHPFSGHVLVNDQPMNATTFRRISGYVTQEEALFPLLTVEETLAYSARLRLNGGYNKANDRVKKLLCELGLDHIAGVRVGSDSTRAISGGEKRRLSIGVDLVHDPAVLLLDEPTSGLDSASALHVMLLLKSMAQNQHKTIVVTIHQPGFRIVELIDNVVLLSNGGGVHNGSLEFLDQRIILAGHVIPRHVNVLEFAIDVADSLLSQTSWSRLTENSDKDVKKCENDNNVYSNSLFKEVVILSQRFSSNIFRNRHTFAARAIQSLLAGIALGTIFMNAFSDHRRNKVQNQMGFFAFTLTFLMSSTTEALPIFLQERRIVTRETSRGAYRVSSYIISNTLVFLPFLLIVALLYTTPVYSLVGLRRDDGFLYFTLVVYMVVLMSNSVVACFSSLAPDFITGMSVISGVMGSFFLFSGYFLAKDTIPKCWSFMQYLSMFKYPFECFMINEYGGQKGKFKCLESIGDECLVYGHGLLMQQGLKESQKWSNLLVMLSFIIGYRFIGFFILWWRCYKTRC